MGNGKKVCLKALENKLFKIIYIKESFSMEKKMGKAKFHTVMAAIIKGTLQRILYKDKANTTIKIIIGKESGRMDTWKDMASK